MFEIDVDRHHEIGAVEKGADRDLDTAHASLQLKNFHRIGVCGLVGFEDMYDIEAVVLLTDKQQPLDVLRFATGLDDVRRRVFADIVDGGVKITEVLKRNNRNAVTLELFLAKTAVIFEPIGVGRSANHQFSGIAKPFGFLALAQNVIEHDNVCPVDVTFPVVNFRYETIGDRTLGLLLDVIANIVTFLDRPSRRCRRLMHRQIQTGSSLDR